MVVLPVLPRDKIQVCFLCLPGKPELARCGLKREKTKRSVGGPKKTIDDLCWGVVKGVSGL